MLIDGGTWNGRAVPRRTCLTCAGVSGGLPAATAALCIIATAAATCGVACEVPMKPISTSVVGTVVPALPVDQIQRLIGSLPLVASPPGTDRVTGAP